MKNGILLFLLGIFVTISIAATVPNTGLFTVKPAKPISTIILTEYDFENWKIYVKQGYQVKTVSEGNYSRKTLILEKY